MLYIWDWIGLKRSKSHHEKKVIMGHFWGTVSSRSILKAQSFWRDGDWGESHEVVRLGQLATAIWEEFQ